MSESHFRQEEEHAHRDVEHRRPVAHAQSPERPYRSAEEARAWSQLYAGIRQPCTAAEVVRHLNADPASRRQHLALYVQASVTLHEQKIANARNQRIGAFVRLVITTLAFGPYRWMKRGSVAVRDITVEAMPPARGEPAATRAPALRNDRAFAKAMQTFATGIDGSGGSEPDSGQSRGVKAA